MYLFQVLKVLGCQHILSTKHVRDEGLDSVLLPGDTTIRMPWAGLVYLKLSFYSVLGLFINQLLKCLWKFNDHLSRKEVH